uniref:B protein n=1 Tax=Agrobacterium tumefaciens TaxID=358 RepID=Q9R714_AGRTU|nr:RolB family protein [Agrobacterium fabrum]AAD30482.1 B protein [Agrobacterium fabrum str. C58]
MYYERPVFDIVDTWEIREREVLKPVLSVAEEDYCYFVQNTVASAQRSWVDLVANLFNSPDSDIDDALNRFADAPCLHGPTLEPMNLILKGSPMYVYCSFEEMRSCATKRFYEGISNRGVVICTVPPYAEGVTRDDMSVWQNQACVNTCSGKNDLDAYIAFLPTSSLQESSYWHTKNGIYSFLAPSQTDAFCCEILCVGRALFEDRSRKEKLRNCLLKLINYRLKLLF